MGASVLPVQNYDQVGDPTSTANADGAVSTILAGRNGDALVSEVHGKWYNAGARGKTFIATNAASIIGLYGTITSLTGMILYNPLGSGKNLELISLTIAEAGSTVVVVSDVRWATYIGVGAGAWVLPTSQVASANIFSNPIGGPGGVPQGKALASCTMGAAASAWMETGFTFGAIAPQPGPNICRVVYDGEIILAPGTLISLQGMFAQTANFVLGIAWAEWPI